MRVQMHCKPVLTRIIQQIQNVSFHIFVLITGKYDGKVISAYTDQLRFISMFKHSHTLRLFCSVTDFTLTLKGTTYNSPHINEENSN